MFTAEQFSGLKHQSVENNGRRSRDRQTGSELSRAPKTTAAISLNIKEAASVTSTVTRA
jgi:hypothetical protein